MSTNAGNIELLTDPGHFREDLRMVRQGIRNGWDIPEALLSALPKVAGAIALDKTESKTVRLKAIETIWKMKAQNDQPEPQSPAQTTINVGVKVEQAADGGRSLASQIVERIRADRLSRNDSGRLT